MSKIYHPMREQTFVFYQHIGGVQPEANREFVGFFSDYQKYPIYFHGPTFEDCRDSAVAFRDGEADKNEKNYLIRIEALRKAREAKKKK